MDISDVKKENIMLSVDQKQYNPIRCTL